MKQFLASLLDLNLLALVRAIIIVVVGYYVAKLFDRGLERITTRFSIAHMTAVWRKIGFYFIFILFFLSGLRELGFDLHVLLGAAGIFTVAFGFAAQASTSNMISGLFLTGERPFIIGDTIKVGETKGEVLSVDLLSTKLRTPDNTLVRIPNEILLKTQIVNLSHFETRRLDCHITLAYQEDVEKVKEVLLDLAAQNSLVLKTPVPSVTVLGFGETAIEVRFSVWATQTDYPQLESELYREIKMVFDQQSIEMSSPTKTMLLHLD